MTDTLVSIRNLSVNYKTFRGDLRAVTNISFEIPKSKIIGIVGESGCGKSSLGLSLIRLLPANATLNGEILFSGRNLVDIDEEEISKLRGTEISMIFQEPMSSLDPLFTIGRQLTEALEVREKRTSTGRRPYGPFTLRQPKPSLLSRLFGSTVTRPTRYNSEILEVLRKVRISDPEKVVDKYPHELSGGMAQRVMIAQAILEKPKLLIADEPTSALDVTSQSQVLQLMRDLRNELGSTIVFITHDLAVAAQIADQVIVMYAGEIVEQADTEELFYNPLHPYTKALLGSFPRFYKEEKTLQRAIQGDVPNMLNPPTGCRFNPRCEHVMDVCRREHPVLKDVGNNHWVSCFLYGG
ncbi:MAG: ABC transporter ATP-binding protein [Thermoprotei archaeon]